MNSDAIELPM